MEIFMGTILVAEITSFGSPRWSTIAEKQNWAPVDPSVLGENSLDIDDFP